MNSPRRTVALTMLGAKETMQAQISRTYTSIGHWIASIPSIPVTRLPLISFDDLLEMYSLRWFTRSP